MTVHVYTENIIVQLREWLQYQPVRQIRHFSKTINYILVCDSTHCSHKRYKLFCLWLEGNLYSSSVFLSLVILYSLPTTRVPIPPSIETNPYQTSRCNLLSCLPSLYLRNSDSARLRVATINKVYLKLFPNGGVSIGDLDNNN